MPHLGERLAEFVFGELSESELAEGRRHLTECADCRRQAERFRQTHAMLKASSDVEPPRRIVFEVEKQSVAPWVWRWLAPMAASAAVALAVVSVVPRPEPQIIERVVQQEPAGQPAAEPIDYQRIIIELRASQEAWLANELQKRDIAVSKEFQRIRGDQDLLYSFQRAAHRDSAEMQASIQQIAMKPDTRE